MKLREDNPSPEQMSDKEIMEKVLGRQSNRLFGWGRSPSKSQGTHNQTSRRPTHDELKEVEAKYVQTLNQLEEVNANYEALKGELDWIRQLLIDRNIMSHSELQAYHHSRPSTSGGAYMIDDEDEDEDEDRFL